MEKFNVIWKFVVVGFLFALTLLLGQTKYKLKQIEELLNIPDIQLPE